MHTACLLGALILLNRRRSEIDGTVFGLFQPGEEVDPGGASLVLAEDPFRDYRVQAVVGEHVGAEIPLGQLGFRPGKYMASGDEVRITVRGRGGHGALPHNLNDPVVLPQRSLPLCNRWSAAISTAGFLRCCRSGE
ncbi:MAG: M20/M25/M40 family metallo-hydrolase [Alistipes indistinctus]